MGSAPRATHHSRLPVGPAQLQLARTIFDQPDAAEVYAHFGRVVTALEAKLPSATEHLSAAREDLLAFTAVPREIWRQIWSSNPSGCTRSRGGAPTWSASSPTGPPSSASSARC
jgi:transposase-like protein